MEGTDEKAETEQQHAAFWENLGLEEKVDTAKQYALDHPISTLFLVVTIAMCSVPIFCFSAFVFTSTLLLFIGFIVVEGSVLMIASLILGAVLLVVGFCSIVFSGFLILAYFTISLAQDMLYKAVEKVTPTPASLGQTGTCDSTTKTQ